MQENLTVARIVHPSTQDIFFPHYGLLQGEDTNTNMINQAAIHRLIFQKIKKKQQRLQEATAVAIISSHVWPTA